MNRYYRMELAFAGKVSKFYLEGEKEMLNRLQAWLQQPGTRWIRVYYEGEQIFQWTR